MDCYALMAGFLVVVAILCLAWPSGTGKQRTENSVYVHTSHLRQTGILTFIEALKAYVKAGGSLEQAFAEQMADSPLYTGAIMPDRAQLEEMMRERLGPKETIEQADHAAVELDLACRLSKTLGCEASHCLDAVASSYRRNRMMKTLKDNAFTVPKSTVKLLSLLPLATLVLGELMGASPILFLFGNAVGHVCLLLGAGTYVLGMLWMHVLMDANESPEGKSSIEKKSL